LTEEIITITQMHWRVVDSKCYAVWQRLQEFTWTGD